VAGFDGLRRVCRDAVAGSVVPGLVVVVGAGGRELFQEPFGSRQTEPSREPATVDTVYDLASLTKALVTSVLVMRAVEQGRLGLDEPLLAVSETEGPTVRQTLAHAAGLAAHRPLYERLGPEALRRPGSMRSRLVALAAKEAPVRAPGSRSVYSDLGFILIGDWLERRLGARLDDLADREIFTPSGLGAAPSGGIGPSFVDLAGAAVARPFGGRPVAPTERCAIRGGLIAGQVHDLNAFAMGGVAGHAGLFGAAGDVAGLAHALCAAWRDTAADGGRPLVSAAVLRELWAPAGIPDSTWRLGWDGPSATGSLAGARIHRRAVGHLGFTGCSLWIDPERETFVAVLSNRVHPTVRDDARFRALRPALNDAALDGARYAA